jgi:hypothetical protein
MMSGVISEAVLVNINNARYFQHGGNLMVKIFSFKNKIFYFLYLD